MAIASRTLSTVTAIVTTASHARHTMLFTMITASCARYACILTVATVSRTQPAFMISMVTAAHAVITCCARRPLLRAQYSTMHMSCNGRWPRPRALYALLRCMATATHIRCMLIRSQAHNTWLVNGTTLSLTRCELTLVMAAVPRALYATLITMTTVACAIARYTPTARVTTAAHAIYPSIVHAATGARDH